LRGRREGGKREGEEERPANRGGDRFRRMESTFQKFIGRSRTGGRKGETRKGG